MTSRGCLIRRAVHSAEASPIRRTNSTIRLCAASLVGASPAIAQTPPVEVARLAAIGCDACGDARELGRIYDVALRSDGTVIVGGPDAPIIRIFSRDGKPLRQIGREGAGPGEFRFPMRVAPGVGGTLHVLDMTLRRVSHLAPDGVETQSAPLSGFPSAAASRAETGEVFVLSDDFRGGLTVFRFGADGSPGTTVSTITKPASAAGVISFPVIAVGPSGELAVGLSGEQYRIIRFTPAGQPLGEIVRDIPRVRRTPEEIAALQRRRDAARARFEAERGRAGGRGPNLRGPDDALKPHFGIDALRYDDAGRLWVLTMRGGDKEAIFDLFAPTGSFLGSLRVPSNVGGYALGGGFLVTRGETDDGAPVVELWSVKTR